MSQFEFKHNYQYEREMEWRLGNFLDHDLKWRCRKTVLVLDAEYAYSDEPVPFEEIGSLEFKPIKAGEVWAKKNFACGWFHITGKLPKDISRENLWFDFGVENEALLVDKNGHAVKGFTSGSPVFNAFDYAVEKRYCPLDLVMDEDGNVDAYIDAASNSILGEFSRDTKFTHAEIVHLEPKLQEIFWDFDVLYDYMKHESFENPKKSLFIAELRKVMNLFIYNDPDVAEKAKAITSKLLAMDGEDNTQVTAVGHAHLDLAWLWPIRESKRKAKRTFSNAIYLLKKYPDYHFVAPQPQQLEWMKELDPALFEEMKEFAREGRFEPVGGGWVENDTNLPNEESLVRQELYGQKFWKEEFGQYVNLRWLPDTFGYSAAMPQILKLSHQEYFMTIKLSWSNRTLFPYHTFYWAGIDGSEVMVHMPPEGTYNSRAGGQALKASRLSLREEDPKDSYMIIYGIGDGGGGPNETMVERCIREEKIAYMPKVHMQSAHGFFDSYKGRELPKYDGEMYLEKHRGTYTSQSNNKNFNREFEEKMYSYEALLSCLGEQGDKGEIDKLWKEALLYQFHDIIPGSSIERVYDETDASYKEMFAKMEEMANAKDVSYKASADKCLLNFAYDNVAKIEKDGDGYLYYQGDCALIEPIVYQDGAVVDMPVIETDFYTITMDKDGSFASIVLNENGEVAVRNANKLQVFVDNGDAWDFEDDYREQPAQFMNLVSSTTRDFGELIEIKQNYEYKNSKLTQTILIHKHEELISVTHDVDWKDTGYMLRAEFTPAQWADVVHNDIQFGYLDRPAVDNTEHDAAQFEMCCQKWFDLSNDKQGFGLINKTKSGFMCKYGIVSLNLLRSTNYPCVHSEQKPLSYSYALYPHTGGFNPVKIDALAKGFNAYPLYGNQALAMPTVDNERVQITAFKPAYDGNGFILRAFERAGETASAKLMLPIGYQLDCEVDLLEDKMADIGTENAELTFKPFQIRSFRIIKA